MNEPNKMISNPALKAALQKMKEERSPTNLNLTINELVKAVMLAPARIEFDASAAQPDEQGRVKLPKDTKINFLLLNTTEGKPYFMAFTDAEELRKWKQEDGQQVMALRFDDYATMLENNANIAGFVINPFGENMRFDAPLVASIKKRKAELVAERKAEMQKRLNRIQPGDNVTLVEPTVYPDTLVDPICAVLADAEQIAAAYLQVMIINETDKSYLLILDGPQDNNLFTAVAQSAKAHLSTDPKKMDLNITVSTSPLGQQGMKGSEPFYVRGKGRIMDEDDD